jgi:hypothetical protein
MYINSLTFDIAVLSKNFTKDTVALLHHDLEVLTLESGRPAIADFPSAGEKNRDCPAVVSTIYIGLPQTMLLFNKIALYHKAAGCVRPGFTFPFREVV